MSSDKSMRVSFAFRSEHGDAKPEVHIDFPTTNDELRQMFEKNGIHRKSEGQISAALYGLEDERYLGSLIDITFDDISVNELNYLAVKLSRLESNELEKFEAIIESGRYLGSAGVGNGDLTDYINIADNLDCFTFHPNMDESGYGEELLSGPDNKIAEILHLLRNHHGSESEEYAQYIECLRESADTEQFGRSMAYNDDGEFLNSGYLIEDGGFNAEYYGVLDIPEEYRIWEESDTFIKVANVDLLPLLLEMHALGGNYTQDAASNLQTLMGGDCFIAVNAKKLTVLPAVEVFHMDSPHYKEFHNACSGNAQVFFAAMSGDDDITGYRGNLHEIFADAIMLDVHNLKLNSIMIDVEFKDGTNGAFTPSQWNELPESDRSRVAGLVHRYDPYGEKMLDTFLSNLRNTSQNNGREITQVDFLTVLNAPFMAKAQNAQPDMLRVARETARDMVARSDAEVYRLLPEGALKLSTLDVIKSNGLWFKEHREFAIKPGGLAGLRKWADRTVDDIARQSLLKTLNKTRENEH